MSIAFRQSETERGKEFKILYLTTESSVIRGTITSVAQVGVCSLLVFRNIFRERFDLLGITETLQKLQRRL